MLLIEAYKISPDHYQSNIRIHMSINWFKRYTRATASSIISSTCVLCNKLHFFCAKKIIGIAMDVLFGSVDEDTLSTYDHHQHRQSKVCVLQSKKNHKRLNSVCDHGHIKLVKHTLEFTKSCPRDCFSLYKDFFNWHTSSLSHWTVKLWDCSMYTYFTKFPWRKCFWFVVDEATTRL